jgi:gliding motility-associated-like protein
MGLPDASMRKLFLLPLFLCLGCLPLMAGGGIKFIPNKGQWDKEVIYRADVGGGRVFFGKDWMRYAFIDSKQIRAIHTGQRIGEGLISQAVFMDYIGSSNHILIEEEKPSIEHYNFYTSNDPKKWATNLKSFRKLTYKNLFQGIDLKIESRDEAIKYTYIVQPGSSPSDIKYKITGADKIEVLNNELHIFTSLNQLIDQGLFAYQIIEGKQHSVPCKFNIEGNVINFTLPTGYDPSLPLIIDPTFIFATYSGSVADNFGFTGTYDIEGDGYSGGTVYGPGFPTKPGKKTISFKAFDPTFNGDSTNDILEEGYYSGDVGILKYNPTGDTLLYATYLGGAAHEQPHSMVVDSQDHLIVFGTTFSYDFPVSSNAYQKKYHDSCDIFVSKFSKNGDSLLASTYIGGKGPDGINGIVTSSTSYDFSRSKLFYNYGDQARGEVIVDKTGNVYIASSTMSKDFVDPIKFPAAMQKKLRGEEDGCVFKLNSDFSKLLWNTLIGGNDFDAAYSLQRDSKGNIFVCGGTRSKYFFSDKFTFQDSLKNRLAGSSLEEDSIDAYVCSLKDDGKTLLNATYLGTNKYDQAYFVQLDLSDHVYLFGQTSSNFFPLKNALYSIPKSGQFIVKFNHNLDTMMMSSTFGKGNRHPDISPSAFLVDDCEKIYISGWGGKVNNSSYGGHGGDTKNLPITSGAYQTSTDGSDFYVAVFAHNMDTILYSSYFGGSPDEEHVDGGTSRFDKRGVVYQSVCGACGVNGNFPTSINAYSPHNNGRRAYAPSDTGCNNLLFKVDLNIANIKADFDIPLGGCSPSAITPKNHSINSKYYYWDFGDGSKSNAENPPSHLYKNPGVYKVSLRVVNLFSCGGSDTLVKTYYNYKDARSSFKITKDSCTDAINLDTFNAAAQKVIYRFGDGDTATSTAIKHIYKSPGNYRVSLIADPNLSCVDSSFKYVNIKPHSDFKLTIDTCARTVRIDSVYIRDSSFKWYFDTVSVYSRHPVYTFSSSGIHSIKLLVGKSPKYCDPIIRVIDFSKKSKPNITYVIDTCSRTIRITGFYPKDSHVVWIFGRDTLKVLYPKYTYSGPGIDTIRLKLLDVCSDTGRYIIKIPDKNKAVFTFNNLPCTGEFAFRTLIYNPKYRWDFGDGTIDSQPYPPKHTYLLDSSFSVRFIINAGKLCADTVTKVIKAKKKKGATFEFYIDTCSGIATFINTTHTGAQSFRWDFGDGGSKGYDYNASHQYKREGEFTVTLYSEPNTTCADTAQKSFHLEDNSFERLLFSNVMTPDGDGKNDVFRISGINERCMNFLLEIFNRWGQLVYKQEGGPGSSLEWNGTSLKGAPLAAGVYYWILQGKVLGRKEGTITIVR